MANWLPPKSSWADAEVPYAVVTDLARRQPVSERGGVDALSSCRANRSSMHPQPTSREEGFVMKIHPHTPDGVPNISTAHPIRELKFRRKAPDDQTLRRTIEESKSLYQAALILGLSVSCVRKHAHRLGVRSRFRLGREKLPDDDTLKHLLRNTTSIAQLSRELDVRPELLSEKARSFRIDARRKVRKGLPDDAVLREDLLTCHTLQELADEYGVAERTVRNQLQRLNLPSPSKRRAMGLGHVSGFKRASSKSDSSDFAELAQRHVGPGPGWQFRIARKLHYPSSTIQNWLRGAEPIPPQELTRLRLEAGIKPLAARS
jgi:DNA-binding CsgD family transcriptional regulator